ncbi:DUF2490 domain-containing protein [Nibribacter koreensis]|uniref:DUF2490 domain-containing protein n=1 Tax=Nibribacter koreensis TaxID=1084519 RepID=A0ABP8FK55_9BACT
MKNWILVLIMLVGLSSNLVVAQTKRVYNNNKHGWYVYTGNHTFTDKWGFYIDVQFRRHDILPDPQQFVTHMGLTYSLSKDVSVAGGYVYAHTYPYGDTPALDDFPEHRAYEQVQLKATYGRFLVQHRFRLEQRFVKRPFAEEATYLNRARYQFKTTLPLSGPTLEEKEAYVSGSNEVFIGFGKNVQANIFDQNRAYAGVGYKFSKAASLEVGYMHQLLQSGGGINFESNHTLQVTVGYNLDFRKDTASQ